MPIYEVLLKRQLWGSCDPLPIGVTKRVNLPFVPCKDAEFNFDGERVWVKRVIWDDSQQSFECDCNDVVVSGPWAPDLTNQDLLKGAERNGWRQ